MKTAFGLYLLNYVYVQYLSQHDFSNFIPYSNFPITQPINKDNFASLGSTNATKLNFSAMATRFTIKTCLSGIGVQSTN